MEEGHTPTNEILLPMTSHRSPRGITAETAKQSQFVGQIVCGRDP